MAARRSAAEETGDRSTAGARTALVRLVTATLAGGAVLLLWGGAASARTADAAPEPAAPVTANDGGLLSGLLGQGGALTPVVDLVDEVTQPLTGSTPVGTTVDSVVTTVDPIVAPVTTPVTEAADPVIAPVIDTVGTVAEGVTTTLTNPVPGAPNVPGSPSTPTTPTAPPVVPPVTGPGSLPLPELPSLLPPTGGAEPGTNPAGPPTEGARSAAASLGSPLPLAVAAGTQDATAARTGTAGATSEPASATAAAAAAWAAPATASSLGASRGDDAPGAHQGHAPTIPAAPAPCAGGSLNGPGSTSVPTSAWVTADGLGGTARAARTIDVPSSPRPAPAPCGGPEVSPD